MGAGALLGRTKDRISKTQETRLNLRTMFEDGTIPLARLMRSMGAVHSKVNVMKKRRLARARAGGVMEEEAEARIQDGGLGVMMDRNTRGVLASITEDQGDEEGRGRGGPARGRREARGGGGLQRGREAVGGRGRGVGAVARVQQGGRGRGGGRGGPPGARRGRGGAAGGGRESQRGREARGGRGRETGVRGWEPVGPNKRRCLYCGGEYSNRYMFTHLRELCRGREENEEETTTEEDENHAEEETTTDNESSEELDVEDIIQQVEELERTVLEERNLGAKRKKGSVAAALPLQHQEDSLSSRGKG